MKQHLLTIVLALVFLIGLALLLYPTVSDYFISRSQSRVVSSYHDEVMLMDESEIIAMFEAAYAYNDRLRLKQDRFSLTDEEYSEYNNLLNVGGRGVIGALEVELVGINLPIYHGTSESVLQVALGHLEGTSLPVGGPSTHTVITGHRGLPSATLLSNIDRLEIGDVFEVRVLNQTLTYQVDQIQIVEPHDFSFLGIYQGRDYATLLTCTPIGINSHRLLVRGHRIESEAAAARRPVILSEAMRPGNLWVILIVLIPALGLILLVRLVIFLRNSWKRGSSK